MDPDDVNATRFFRTSKEAFGHPYYAEKKDREWAWVLGAALVFILIATAVVWYRTQ